LKKILGAFKTSPSMAMEIEAAIPPPEVRFTKICKNYAFRILQIENISHPIRKRAPDTFPPGNSFGIPNLNLQKYLDWNHQPNAADKKKKFPSQLYAVLNSICKELPSLNIEKMSQPKAPWTPNPEKLIDFATEKIDKKSAAEKHRKFVNPLLKNPGNIIMYTDGSKNQERNKNAAASICIFYKDEKIEKGWKLSNKIESNDAEIFAIKMAYQEIKKQTNQRIRHAWIFTDSLLSVQQLRSNTTSQNSQNHEEIIKMAEKLKVQRNIQLHIHWVKGHSKIQGNECANKIAKRFANSERKKPISNHISLTHIKRGIKNSVLKQWSEKWQKCKEKGKHYCQFETQPGWKPIKIQTTKKVWSTYMQLKLGHGYFKSYLQRLPNYEPRCSRNCSAI